MKTLVRSFLVVFALTMGISSAYAAKAYTWNSPSGDCWVCNGGNPNVCTYCHDGGCATLVKAADINVAAKMVFGPITPRKVSTEEARRIESDMIKMTVNPIKMEHEKRKRK